MCSEVEQRFLLYLAANSSALDQANGSIGFVGGAAGRCLGYKHSPILAKSKPLWESRINFWLILWDYIGNPRFHIKKINALPTPNRQNRLFIAGKCGTWAKRMLPQSHDARPINGAICNCIALAITLRRSPNIAETRRHFGLNCHEAIGAVLLPR